MDRGSWRAVLETLEASNEKQLSSSLKTLLQLSLEFENRQSVTQSDIDSLSRVVINLLPTNHSSTTKPADSSQQTAVTREERDTAELGSRPEVLVDLFKLLRNLCAGIVDNQRMIIDHADILPRLIPLCNQLCEATPTEQTTPTDHHILLKVILQLLGNACAGYPDGQKGVWLLCYPDLFRQVLSGDIADDVIDMCCMVIHNCTVSNEALKSELCSPSDDVNCPSLIGQLCRCLSTEEPSEWMVVLFESLVESTPLDQLWSCLRAEEDKERLTLLKFVLSRVNDSKYSNMTDDVMELALRSTHSGESSSDGDELVGKIINERNLPFFEMTYHRYAGQLLSGEVDALRSAYVAVTTDLDNSGIIMVQTTIALLRLLCRCAEVEKLLLILQQRTELLDISIDLLRQLASLDGSESSAQHRSKLSKVKPSGKEPQHPLFGMKRDLVQLISNLVFKSVVGQDRVREVGGIPLILNQCSIDHFNPFITQCAVWAIRNLCEENPANQTFIAELENKGVAETQELLEFGVEVKIGDDGKIKIKRGTKSPSESNK